MARWLPGAFTLSALLLLIGGALGALAYRAPELDLTALWHNAYLHQVIGFTFWQAFLSTLLSVGLALPVARSLARRPVFWGRAGLLKLFGLPLVVPTIVAVFGIVAVYGQSGLLNRVALLIGLPTQQFLYGLPGILIAHIFFNLPLTVKLLLPLWQTVPGETWRLAGQLGMSSAAIFRLIEWPLLRQALPGAAGLVFMLCFTSFAVVLTLGGGPAATTIEVAIYQALRFDFDLGQAVLLALLQLTVCTLFVGLAQRLTRTMRLEASASRPQSRPDTLGKLGQLSDGVVISLAALSVVLPLAAVLYAGFSGPLGTVLFDTQLWQCALRSLVIALSAGLLAVFGGLSLLQLSRALGRHKLGPAVEWAGSVVLVVPPLVLGTGFFVLLNPFANVFDLALGLVVIVNALMGLPYVIRILGPPYRQLEQQHGRLCVSLGLSGRWRLYWLEWPLLRRPLGLALALCAALASGDLGVIALFGTQDTVTLPLLLYQRLSSYQTEQAAVTALVLIGLCLGLFIVIERLVGGRRA